MPPSQKDIFLHAVQLFLRPLARFCLRRSIKLQEAIETMKLSFLEVAHQEMAKKNQKVTASRLSIMTGVHRKDVIRLLDGGDLKYEDIALPTRIIGQWRNNAQFRSITGRPKILTFGGVESEFSDLVRSVSKELNPYTVLFELERIDAVEKLGDRIKLKSQVYVPRGDIKKSLEMLAADAEDLYEAVEENIFEAPKIPHLHVTTTYDNICADSIPEIKEWFLNEGEKLHKKAREFLSKHDRDVNPTLSQRSGGVSVSLGTVSRIYTADK